MARVRENDDGSIDVELWADYEPHEAQRRFHAADCDRVIAYAGRRGGKTHGGGHEFLKRVFEDVEEGGDRGWERPEKITDRTEPAYHYWLVAPTYEHTGYQIRAVLDALLEEDVSDPEESPLVIADRPSSYEIWLAGGIKIEQKSAERPKRLVAAGLDGVWVDEAARVKEGTWDDNIRGTLTDKRGWAIFTTTPLGTTNWTYEKIWSRAEDPENSDYTGVKFHTADNTAVEEVQEEVERAREELPEEIFARNYRADVYAFRGKVYKAFSDSPPHRVTRIPYARFERRIAGLDWGFSDPGAVLEIGIDDLGRWWVYREHYRSDLLVTPPEDGEFGRETWQSILEDAVSRGVEKIWADPSEPRPIDKLSDAGLPIEGAENDVNPGIDAVRTLLAPDAEGEPSLFVHERCTNTRSELGSYRWKDNAEKPVKEDDHTCDALRYGVFSEHLSGGGVERLEGISIFGTSNVDGGARQKAA